MKTIPELASALSLPETTIRDARRRGVFPSQKVGRDWVVDDESKEFVAWLAAREYQPRVKGGAKGKTDVSNVPGKFAQKRDIRSS